MYSLGIGIQPLDAQITYFGISATTLTVRPFLVADGGILGGRAWKLRLVYFPVNTVWMNKLGKLDDNYLNTKLTGSSDLKISLLIMLRSNHWGG